MTKRHARQAGAPARPTFDRRLCALLALLLVTLTLTGGAPGAHARSSADSDRSSENEVLTYEYDAQVAVVSDGVTYPERLRGLVHVSTASRPHPVVLFLHGRHEACRAAGETLSVGPVLFPCPDAGPVEDLPSWRGYDYVARDLARAGYLVISINANTVNSVNVLDGTRERSELIDRSLALLAEWNEGARSIPDGVGDALVDKVDLSRIGLMGHSRGADAVGFFLRQQHEAGADANWPGLKAILQIAGVDIPGANPAPVGAHVGVMLGSCDADTGPNNVRMWERGRYHKEAAHHDRVLVMLRGANHNFFNREWYDEWDPPATQPFPLNEHTGNPACSAPNKTNIRLSRGDQEAIAQTYIAAFMRRYVGGEREFDRLLRGDAGLPAGACPKEGIGPGAPLPCADVVGISYLGRAADRTHLLQPSSNWTRPDERVRVSARGFDRVTTCSAQQCPELGNRSIADQMTLEWTRPARLNVTIAAPIEGTPQGLSMRAAMNPNSPLNKGIDEQDLTIRVTDRSGATAQVSASRFASALIRPVPDDGTPYESHVPERKGYRSMILNGIFVPFRAFHGIDADRIARVELVFDRTASGSIQLADLVLQ